MPPQGQFGTAGQRDDLIAIFLTGIPNLTQPANGKPAEELRLNVAVPVTGNPNAYGVIGGDNQGYPNGRRLTDDVVDISLRAIAGAAYPLFHPGFTVDATGAKLGDGVDANDKTFRTNFPYLALPAQGFASIPHPGNANVGGSQGGTNNGGNQAGRDEVIKNITKAREEFNNTFNGSKDEFENNINQAKDQFSADINQNKNPNEAKDRFINSLNTTKDRFLNMLNQTKDRFNDALNNSNRL